MVGKLNGLNCKEPKDFVQILAIIDRDMHLGLSDKSEMRISSTTSVPVIAEVTHVPKRKKARPYTLAQRALRLRNLPFGEKVVSRKRC